MQVRLNPALNAQAYAREYAQKKFVQIPNIFEPEVADAIERTLLSLPWRLLVQDENKQNTLLTMDELAKMPAEERRALETRIRDRAANGFGYTYFAYPLVEAYAKGWDRGHPIHDVVACMNSPPFVNFARAVSGCPSITHVDGHATHFGRGHYLLRHVDTGDRNERRAAFTLGFSRNWQADWGGLLLFLDGKQDVINGFLPRFNVMTVFDGAVMDHNVSAISTFAPKPRLSFAGWFFER